MASLNDRPPRRFANEIENDRRVAVGFDLDAVEPEIAAAPPAGADLILQALLFVRGSSRPRMALDCVFLFSDGGRFEPELSARAIARKYTTSHPTVLAMLERVRAELARNLGDAAALRDMAVLRLLAYLRARPHLLLTIDCLILAYGGNRLIPDLTMRSVARRRGVSPETVSNVCDRIRRDFHLPANKNNKPEAARRSYAKFNYRPAMADAG